MIRHFIILLVCVFSLNLQAQESDIKRNAVSIEFAGSGLLYSINYDRILIVNENMRFTYNVGFWYIPALSSISDFNYMIGGTAGVSTLFGKSKHFAEFGINLSYMTMKDIEDNQFHSIYQPIRMGYRFQKDEGGLFIKAAFMPIISILQDKDAEFLYPVTPHFSASIGYSF